MKGLIFLFISVIVFQTENWITKIDDIVKEIDSSVELIKTKTQSDSTYIFVYNKYKSGDWLKSTSVITFKKEPVYLYSTTFYQLKNELIYLSDYSFSPYFTKGSGNNLPFASIKETKKYYKPDFSGVLLSREIDVFHNQNVDSLKLELKKLEFESSVLTVKDYKKDLEILKRLKKFK